MRTPGSVLTSVKAAEIYSAERVQSTRIQRPPCAPGAPPSVTGELSAGRRGPGERRGRRRPGRWGSTA
jgi:hypothetical protein